MTVSEWTKNTLVYNGSHAVHFIKHIESRDIQICTSVSSEVADHGGVKIEGREIAYKEGNLLI